MSLYTPPAGDSANAELDSYSAPADYTSIDFIFQSEPVTIGGTVDASSPENVKIFVVNVERGSVEATTVPASTGDWSADVPKTGTYHVLAQYDDGTEQMTHEGYPYINPT